MARLFGALANAGAQYNKGRFAREQYDAEQQKIARDEARRAFEFGVTNDRLMQQAKEATELRKAAQERLNQQDQFKAIQAGAEDTPVESLAAASQAFLQGQGMGMPQQAVRAPQTARKVQQADGIDFSADQKGAPAYINAGGRVLRYDPQKAANSAADKAMRDHLTKIMMEKERSAGDRAEIELRASLRPQPNPPQRRTQIVKDDQSGEFVIVDMDQPGPTGLRFPKTGTGGAKTASGEGKAQRTALEDVTAQYYAMASKGAVPSIGLSDAYLMTKLSDPTAGPMETTAARAMMAKAGPQAQQLANFLARLNAVVMPARGGKAITMNEVKVIMGGAMPVAGESEDMRRQRMDAIFEVVGPLLAAEDGDYYGAIDRVKQRAATYSGAKKAAGSVSFDAALQSIKR